MEISHFRGLSDLTVMEDPCFNFPWPVNSFDDQMGIAAFGDNMNHVHALAPVFDYYKPVMEPSSRPTKQLKTNSMKSCITTDHSFMNQNLSYIGDSGFANQVTLVRPKEEITVSSKANNGFISANLQSLHVQVENQPNSVFNKSGGAKVTSPSNTTRLTPAQDHILAERKRREKLSQRFIALSALVPGLKKMDKASVLGDAIKHLKHLQEKVNTLEEQTKKRSNTESVVFVKRYEMFADVSESSSSDENFSGGPVHDQLPEIEARLSGKDVLVRVHCEKKAGILEKILAEIEKLHLSVVNSSTMTFANYALDITVIARMDEEFVMTMKDLVKNLRFALKKFM